MCAYELRYPSKAGYLDNLDITVAMQEYVNIHIAVKKIGQDFTNENMEGKLYSFYDTPGNIGEGLRRTMSIGYPWTFHILIEPTSVTNDVILEMMFWFTDT